MGVPVSRVVRQVVTEHAPQEHAPQERELLDAVERMTPRDRRRHLETSRERSRERSQEPSTVGFGLEVVVPLVTPVLWLVLTEAARETAATAMRASAQAARSRRRRFRGRGREPEGEPEITLPLSAEQLGVVRDAVLTQCGGARVEHGPRPGDRQRRVLRAVHVGWAGGVYGAGAVREGG